MKREDEPHRARARTAEHALEAAQRGLQQSQRTQDAAIESARLEALEMQVARQEAAASVRAMELTAERAAAKAQQATEELAAERSKGSGREPPPAAQEARARKSTTATTGGGEARQEADAGNTIHIEELFADGSRQRGNRRKRHRSRRRELSTAGACRQSDSRRHVQTVRRRQRIRP